MTTALATITLRIDPVIELGPFDLAWHGIMTAVGLVVGGLVAARFAKREGLDPAAVTSLVVLAAVTGIAGARLFFLALNEPAQLADPTAWLGSRGFAIYGAVLAAPIAVAIHLRRAALSARYLDALAYGFPFGLAVGRIGDVVNGEHFGPPTGLPWGIRWTHPEALVRSPDIAYHSGGLYEVLLGMLMAALMVPAARRLTRPTSLLWLVLALYGAGRFVMFFWREDSGGALIGLNAAQLVSAALVGLALAGATWARRRFCGTPVIRLPAPSRPPRTGSA